MDLKVIGKFIQERRKEKNLTQLKLSEILGVSEKTVSKWESGRGFPDTTLMLPLCSALNITANELLSGKILSNDKEYQEIAEQNLITMTNLYKRNTKFLLLTEWIIISFSIIILLASCLVFEYINISKIWKIFILCFGFIISFIGFFISIIIETKVGFYECRHCSNKYIPTYNQVLWTIHMGRTRYMKCPKCGKKSWNKKVISSNKEIKDND